jgi:hypothetical protein
LRLELFPVNSIALYQPAPASVTTIPHPFNHPTCNPKTTIPNRIVRHCFTFPQIVIVKAPAFLFAENEAILSTNASNPFPAKARASFLDGRIWRSEGVSEAVELSDVGKVSDIGEVSEFGERRDKEESERPSEESSPDNEE